MCSTPLHSADVNATKSTLWLGRAELYPDRIVLTGWSWTGRVHRAFALDQIDLIETWSGVQGPNFLMHFGDSRRQPLRLENGLGLWHWELKDLGVNVRARS